MLFIVMSALLLVFLAVLGIQSLYIAGTAGLYPQALIGTCFILLLVCSVQRWRRRAMVQPDQELASLHSGSPVTRARFVSFCLIWVIYPFAMPFLGFTASSVIAFYASSFVFGTTRPILTLFWIVVFVIIFAVLLKTVIYVPVPEAWPDKLINNMVYRF